MRAYLAVFAALVVGLMLIAGCSQKEQLPSEKNIEGLDAQVENTKQAEQVLNEQNADIGADLEQVSDSGSDLEAVVPDEELNSISTSAQDAQVEQDIYDPLSMDIDTTI